MASMLMAAIEGASPNGPPAECLPSDLPMGIGRGGSAQIKGPADVSAAGLAKWMTAMRSMRTA